MVHPYERQDSTSQDDTKGGDAAGPSKIGLVKPVQSCDACRQRKIKCVFADAPNSANPESAAQITPPELSISPSDSTSRIPATGGTGRRCIRCTDMRIDCQFEYQVKKRGPPKGSTRQVRNKPNPTDDANPTDEPSDQQPTSGPSRHRKHLKGQSLSSSNGSSSRAPNNSTTEFPFPHSMDRMDSSGSVPASAGPSNYQHRMVHRPSYDQAVPPENYMPGPETSDYYNPTTLGRSPGQMSQHFQPDQLPRSGSSNGPSPLNPQAQTPQLPFIPFQPITGFHSFTKSPSIQHRDSVSSLPDSKEFSAIRQNSFGHAVEMGMDPRITATGGSPARPRSTKRLGLEDVLPRHIAGIINEIYFEFIWHLVPIMHIPSYRHDFVSERDKGDPAFLALILSVMGSVMIAVPKSWLPPGTIGSHPQGLRELVTRCVTCSDELLDSLHDPEPNTLVMTCHYLNTQIYFNLGWEERRRGSMGQTILCLLGMRLFDPSTYAAIANPIELELRKRLYWVSFGMDKSHACLRDEPMLIRSGEYGSVEMPRALDDECISVHGFAEQPAETVPAIAGFIHISRLFAIQEEILGLYRNGRHWLGQTDIAQTLTHLSILLKRNREEMNGCVVPLRLRHSLSTDDSVPDISRLRDFFDTRAVRGNAFLVAQGNIYVTQQWIRYLVLQCRLSLVRKSGLRFEVNEEEREETCECICRDLLMILRSIPIECIAANGLALVSKIRYIAGGLLNEANESSANGSGQVSANTQSILLDFLVLMSEIEKNYAIEQYAHLL